jgi:hypothetical protein
MPVRTDRRLFLETTPDDRNAVPAGKAFAAGRYGVHCSPRVLSGGLISPLSRGCVMFKVGAMKGRAFAVLLTASVCLLSGCGKPVGNVAGKVTYKGKALEFGTVSIYAADGTACGEEIKPDGTYLVRNVPVGKGKVVVTAQDPKKIDEFKKAVQASRDQHTPITGKALADANSINTIPASYGSADTSGLTVEVKTGTTPYDIELK